jgi:hypothetical protein
MKTRKAGVQRFARFDAPAFRVVVVEVLEAKRIRQDYSVARFNLIDVSVGEEPTYPGGPNAETDVGVDIAGFDFGAKGITAPSHYVAAITTSRDAEVLASTDGVASLTHICRLAWQSS